MEEIEARGRWPRGMAWAEEAAAIGASAERVDDLKRYEINPSTVIALILLAAIVMALG